ncbi:MAG: twin-arginine translocase subunit TatC, partial [Coriobacteriia bacterium]|nr:twin-arginine translocase subunit TatC [Coriobacteriia bacterium]
MPVGSAQMPLFDHLSELRRRITVIVVALLVASCTLYLFLSAELVFFLMQPVSKFLLNGDTANTLDDLKTSIYVLSPLAGFVLRFKVSFYFAVLITCPVWIWQILGFFLPALEPNERKWVIPTFFAAVLLFAFGMV